MPALLSLPLLISFSSHLGGVGKTTSVQNIAYILVSIFKLKVLVVDMDARANLTALLEQQYFQEFAQPEIQKLSKDKQLALTRQTIIHMGQEAFLNRQQENPLKRETVFEMFKGEKGEGCKYHLQWVQENFEKVLAQVSPITIPLHQDKQKLNFLFIAGDSRITDIETELNKAYENDAMNSDVKFPSFYDFMPGLITSMIRKVGKRFGVDIILMDFGPASSALHRTALMGSDYFAVNCIPDSRSQRSLKSLSKDMKIWSGQFDVLRKDQLKDHHFGACPKFLGCIISHIKMCANEIANDKSNHIDSIKEEMKAHLSTPFGDDEALFLESPSLIRDFTRLSDRADMIGKAISHICPGDLTEEEKKDFEDEDIALGANLNLNSYFAAIISLFSNFSEAHHKALGNVFKLNLDEIFPQKDSSLTCVKLAENDPTLMKKQGTKGDILEVLQQKRITTETVTKELKAQINTGKSTSDFSADIYCALSRYENNKNRIIIGFCAQKKSYEQARSRLTEVVEEIKQKKTALAPGIIKDRMPCEPQLNKLCYRISSEFDRNLRKKERMKNLTASQKDVSESQKIDEKLIEKYLNTYRSTREAAAELARYLRQDKTITFLQSNNSKVQPAEALNKNGKRRGQPTESSHEVVTKKRKGA